jgi:hypothetical protein
MHTFNNQELLYEHFFGSNQRVRRRLGFSPYRTHGPDRRDLSEGARVRVIVKPGRIIIETGPKPKPSQRLSKCWRPSTPRSTRGASAKWAGLDMKH